MLIQKKLMANSFTEGANAIFPEGLTPYHIAESYCTIWVYVGSHAVCALPMLPVVLLGWEESGAEGRTAFVLGALGDVGFAAVDDAGRYHLGDRLLGLTSADGSNLAATLRPVIERVAKATGETVDLSVLRGHQMWFIDQIESGHRLRAVSAIGERFPLTDTANGKAALALLDDEQIPSSLLPGIRGIRESGIAYDRDEHTGGISAAGIAGRLPGGHIVAISVPTPTERFAQREPVIVDALRAARSAPEWTPGLLR